jgi:nucleotide-binding universal stress UspA family protein
MRPFLDRAKGHSPLGRSKHNRAEQAGRQYCAGPIGPWVADLGTDSIDREKRSAGASCDSRRRTIDLIVIATHGRSESRSYDDSVAREVVRDGRKPALLVRPKEGTL